MLKQKELQERATGGLFCEHTEYVATAAAYSDCIKSLTKYIMQTFYLNKKKSI